jgi:beta-glucosidase
MVKGHEKGKMSYEEAVARSINAGCDFSDKEFMTYIPAAVRQGLLSEARLDDAVFRVMRDRFRLGEFDPPAMVPFSAISPEVIDSPEHRQLALRAAQKSMVLLTNKDQFLPLDRSKLKTIAVIGPHADTFTPGGYSGRAKDPVTPLAGMKNRAGANIEILYAVGGQITAGRPARGQPAPPFDRAAELRKAVDMAAKADAAVVFVGTNRDIEAEGRDRTSLELPGNQEQLVEAVIAANPRTVVVMMNAGPLVVPWIKDHAAALLEAWWAGEEGGNAIADVLFGNVNPGAKLPYTVYASADQVPPRDEYDVTRGFTYMYINGQPLFPFGHGLSYSTYSIGNLALSSNSIGASGKFTAIVDVKNTGSRRGDEVVQLYVHERNPSVKRPAEELRGFARVTLEPGQSKTIALEVPAAKLAFYDVNTHGFVVRPGPFDILVGSSSQDIAARAEIQVVAEK